MRQGVSLGDALILTMLGRILEELQQNVIAKRWRRVEGGLTMPMMRCQEEGKPGWKWGESGKCYTYDPDEKDSERRAKMMANRQMRAIEASKHREG
jgi:hypothetical protein